MVQAPATELTKRLVPESEITSTITIWWCITLTTNPRQKAKVPPISRIHCQSFLAHSQIEVLRAFVGTDHSMQYLLSHTTFRTHRCFLRRITSSSNHSNSSTRCNNSTLRNSNNSTHTRGAVETATPWTSFNIKWVNQHRLWEFKQTSYAAIQMLTSFLCRSIVSSYSKSWNKITWLPNTKFLYLQTKLLVCNLKILGPESLVQVELSRQCLTNLGEERLVAAR